MLPTIVLIISLIGPISFGGNTPLQKKALLQDRRATLPMTTRLENSTVEQAFFHLLASAGIPGGVVLSPECCRIAHNFEIKGMTLPQALDYVTSYDLSYTWDFDHGAVYLHPRQMPPFLETRITAFKRGPESLDGLKAQLVDLPEVRAAREKLDLHPARLMGGIHNPSPQLLSIDLHNTTLCHALNALVERHGRAIWQYGQDTGSREFNLIFLVH